MFETDLSYAYFNGIPNTTSLHNQFRAYNASRLGRISEDVTWRDYLRYESYDIRTIGDDNMGRIVPVS